MSTLNAVTSNVPMGKTDVIVLVVIAVIMAFAVTFVKSFFKI